MKKTKKRAIETTVVLLLICSLAYAAVNITVCIGNIKGNNPSLWLTVAIVGNIIALIFLDAVYFKAQSALNYTLALEDEITRLQKEISNRDRLIENVNANLNAIYFLNSNNIPITEENMTIYFQTITSGGSNEDFLELFKAESSNKEETENEVQ